MGLDCIILPTSAKSSRRTKADIQRELDSLKTEVQKQNLAQEAQTLFSSSVDAHPLNVTSPQSLPVSPESAQPEIGPGSLGASNTQPRTLNGLRVEADKIDDCFAL